jgi:hypothetical protein
MNMQSHAVIALLLLSGILAGCQEPRRKSLVNFSHLEHLTERIDLAGTKVSIVHIYANYPDYSWTDAKESGPEGIACVDDAARAAVVYLRDFELNRRTVSLERARRLLDFILTMQAEDGEFWNFILADHSVNRDGKTSCKSFGWWAARGVWSLGLGCRVFREVDSAYASRLRGAVERSLPHVRALLQKFGKMEQESGYRKPTWLLYGSGADATSELMLGLIEYYQVARSRDLHDRLPLAHEVHDAIVRFADGFQTMQEGDLATFPYGLHRSWGTLWHLWGNGQTQALATAGRVLGDSAMIQSARQEADGFYARLLAGGLMREMDLADPASRKEFDQIAYGIRPMAVGLLRLYDATGNADYLRMAGLAASWFFGNNPAGVVMYDSATGRCFDGILSATEINRNSGAESTIEALMALVELDAYPEALRFCRFRRMTSDSLRAEFVSPAGERVTLHLDPVNKRFWFE